MAEAWGTIQDNAGAVVQPGTTVTFGGLGITSDEFDALKVEGSVRDEAYPEVTGFETPNEVLAREVVTEGTIAAAVVLLEDAGYTVTPPV